MLASLRRLSTELSAAQVGVTLTTLLLGYLATPSVGILVRPPLLGFRVPETSVPAIASLLASYLHAVLREMVPKTSRSPGPEGLLEAEQHGLTTPVLQFSDRVAADVAVPVDSLGAVTMGVTPGQVERLVATRGFSRLPARAGCGELIGYLHLKDILCADDVQRDDPCRAGASVPW